MAVERFRGRYFPLSNTYPLENWISTEQGIMVPTSEHAYMANRFVDAGVHSEVAAARSEAGGWKDAVAAKQLAHHYIEAGYELTHETDEKKISIMRRVIEQKLTANASIMNLLLSTGDEQIYEGNDWGDTFWGVSPVGDHSSGYNHLGNIYMSIRDDWMDSRGC